MNKKLKMIGLSMVMTLSMFLVDFGFGKIKLWPKRTPMTEKVHTIIVVQVRR
ncbi:hypothetical protein Q5O89_21730 [Peribacillus frigoritolerans]|nr:hypothetical protein [Peribacillus frigoritolerans]